MKKFIIALVAVVLGLSSCSKEAQLLGSWKLESITATVNGIEMTIPGEELGVDMRFTFKENGKFEASANGESEGEANYTVAGNTITMDIGEEVGSISFEFSVTKDTLVLSGNFGEIFGDESITNGRMTFKKL